MLLEYKLSTLKENFYNITSQIRKSIIKSVITDGITVVPCPHTTAGSTLNENAVPDMLLGLDKALPYRAEFCHGEGNSEAHLKANAAWSGVTVINADDKPVLGTWRGIYFCEFGLPKNRKFYAKMVQG